MKSETEIQKKFKKNDNFLSKTGNALPGHKVRLLGYTMFWIKINKGIRKEAFWYKERVHMITVPCLALICRI